MDSRHLEGLSQEYGGDFIRAVMRCLGEARRTPDAECLELSGALEQRYLLNHLDSAWNILRLLRQALPPAGNGERAPGALLDIGTSPLTFVYRFCLEGASVGTVDMTPLLGKRCRGHGIEHRCCNLLTDPLPYEDGRFDACVFTGVMEHLPIGPGSVFREIRRVLKPSGTLVFSLPNSAYLTNRIRALVGLPVLDPIYEVFKEEPSPQSSGQGEWVHGFGHVREFTMSETIDIVRHYGFDPVEQANIAASRHFAGKSSVARKILLGLHRIASTLVPDSRKINLVLARKL